LGGDPQAAAATDLRTWQQGGEACIITVVED